MRRIAAWLLIAALICTLTACGKETTPTLAEQLAQRPAEEQPQKAPETTQPVQTAPTTQKQEQETEPKPEQKPEPEQEAEPVLSGGYAAYDGTYRLQEKNSEGIQTYLVLRGFPDFLMLEVFQTYEGSTFSFWVEEFWPDDVYALGTAAELHGKSQQFSLMSRGDDYSNLPLDRTIAWTPEGICLSCPGFDDEIYVRDDSYGPYHTPVEELISRLDEMFTVRREPTLAGCWELWDGWRTIRVTLEEQGGFHFLAKEPGKPVRIMDGAWGVDTDTGDIQIHAELAGDGQFPYTVNWQWRLDENGYLYLTDPEQYILQEMGNDMGFWPASETDSLFMDQSAAMGYVWNYYEMSGEYTDQYGTDYFYSYCIPVFLEENGDLAALNSEILEVFVPLVEDELAAMEAKEFLTVDCVDWDIYVTEDIVTLHVYSYSWEVEQHRTWYFDLRTNTRTDSRELLRRIGIEEEAFLEAVRSAAEAYYIDAFSEMPEADRKDYGYYERLEWTVSEEAVNLELPMFVDFMGELCVYARIGSIAGADEFWTPLYPFAEWDGAVG